MHVDNGSANLAATNIMEEQAVWQYSEAMHAPTDPNIFQMVITLANFQPVLKSYEHVYSYL